MLAIYSLLNPVKTSFLSRKSPCNYATLIGPKDNNACFQAFMVQLKNFKKSIVDIYSLEEADTYIDANTWLLLDIDNTLLEATQYWGHIHCIDAQRAEMEGRGMSSEAVTEKMREHWIQAHIDCPIRPMEASAHEWIRRFQEKSAYTLGLTHRYTDQRLIECTFSQLSSIGIDLSSHAPKVSSEAVSIRNLPAHALYQSGIIFAGENHKGPALKAFLESFELGEPPHLVFIEDKLPNLKSVHDHAACNLTGLHYRIVETRPQVCSEEVLKGIRLFSRS